jgi:hypothetical protein
MILLQCSIRSRLILRAVSLYLHLILVRNIPNSAHLDHFALYSELAEVPQHFVHSKIKNCWFADAVTWIVTWIVTEKVTINHLYCHLESSLSLTGN